MPPPFGGFSPSGETRPRGVSSANSITGTNCHFWQYRTFQVLLEVFQFTSTRGPLKVIDTIKLSYPLNLELDQLLQARAETLTKCAPDGAILWEKSLVRGDCMPSHYSGLRITTRKLADLIDQGFKPKAGNLEDVAYFEFSLQKWQSPSAYNNKNTTLDVDLKALNDWIFSLSMALGYDFTPERFKLNRVDLSQNFIVTNSTPVDYLRSLELRLSRHPSADEKTERNGHMIALRSPWVGKKLYFKGQEFLDIERKKHPSLYSLKRIWSDEQMPEQHTGGLVPLTQEEIADTMRMIRFEIEFKLRYLKRYEIMRIKDIPQLVERFENEKAKYINVPVLEKGDFSFSPTAYQVIDGIRRHGLAQAKANFFASGKSERTWYRIKKELQERGIHIEALDNAEYRLHGLDIFINPEQLAFQMQLAAFQGADNYPGSLPIAA